MIALSLWEASDVLGITSETIRRWIRKGKLQAFKLPGRAGWRIPVTEIERIGVPPEIALQLAEMAQMESRRRRLGKGASPRERFSGSSGRKKALSFLRSGG